MAVAMMLSNAAFEELAVREPGRWELHRGRLVERPGMSMAHNDIAMTLARLIGEQLPRGSYRLRAGMGHLSRPTASYFVPDVFVVPVTDMLQFRGRLNVLEQYDGPLPFVAEVWSPSTGEYDIDEKIPEYRLRRDREIWRVYPPGRYIDAHRLRVGGHYETTRYEGDVSAPIESLPVVTIELAILFEYA